MSKELKKLSVIFMGTPDFAVPILQTLIDNTNVVLVVSQPDAVVGRKKELRETSVKKLAKVNNIPVFQPIKIKEDYDTVINMQADIIITCAYGQIIPKIILDFPQLGCINVHASLLPNLRGGAPIHKALIDGYDKTGITIMYMDEKMDTGDIISQEEYFIKDSDNVGNLHEKLSAIGASLLLKTLPSIINNTNLRIKQDDAMATYAYNIKREEEKINFNNPSKDIFNQVRGLNPWPLAFTKINDLEIKVIECDYIEHEQKNEAGIIVKITKEKLGISSQDGTIYITKLKPFGKKEMLVKDYLNGINKEELLNKKIGE